MKHILLLLAFVLSLSVGAQTLTPAGFVVGGKHTKIGGASLSCSIGQIFAPTLRNNNVLTQGIQQPENLRLKKTDSKDIVAQVVLPADEYRVFPNPASEVVFVENSEIADNCRVLVFDIVGRNCNELLAIRTEVGKITMDVSRLAIGSYVALVLDSGKVGKTTRVRFVKN
ncbi:MAG: hypothetical protein RIS47_647 [Bacteroidota bacterium]|jgi:hypothetical protein